MATCRDVIADALALLGAIAPGGEPTIDELDAGLAAISSVLLGIHESRGPLADIDVTADFVAGENQRLRVQAGANVKLTLPNSILRCNGVRVGVYGVGWVRDQGAVGSIGPADGFLSRAPRDGSRIEVVGDSQALYFYRADLNAWVAANPLTLDGPLPLNARFGEAMSALVAERLSDAVGVSPSPGLLRRVARGNSALMLQSGVTRDPTRADYF